MTILRIERLSPIETQKHCISNSLKYNASLHFLYRHVDIITLLSCTLSESDCIYQKRSQQFIHALLTSYNTTHFIYFAASQTIFLFLNITSVFPPSLIPTYTSCTNNKRNSRLIGNTSFIQSPK